MIYVALSPLYAVYGDPIRVGWLITAFTLTAGASAAIGGRLGDLYGRRRMLIVMLAIGFAGSMLSALSEDLVIVIIGRALQGVTMAILPLCFGILREHLEPRQIAFGVSLLGATYSITTGIGTLVGGLIVDIFAWHGIFFVSAGTAALALVATLLFVPPSPSPPAARQKLDVVGGILLAPGVAAVFLGLTEAARSGGGPMAVPALVAGLLLLGAWVRHELRHPFPLIELRLLRNRRVALANLAIFLMSAGPMLSAAAILPLLQQPAWTGVGFAWAATAAGAAKFAGAVTGSSSILAAGALAKWLETRTLLLVGALANIVGWSLLAVSMDQLWVVVGVLVFLVMPGNAVIFGMVPHVIIQAAPPERTSEATGISQVVRSLGLAVGAQVIAMCLASELVGRGDARFPAASAYALLYAVFAGCALLSLTMLLMIPTRKARAAAAGAPGVTAAE
jgi:MFS family permease